MEQTISKPASDEAVAAELEFIALDRPPAIQLAFNGLDEPQSLWADLASLGWNIPPCPPRPSSAIEWVPDPETGNDYTIHNWRVKEFKIGFGNWTAEQAKSVGKETVAVLRRHDVSMIGLPEGFDAIPAEPDLSPPPIEQVSSGAPAPDDLQTKVIVVEESSADANVSLAPGFSAWDAIAGREMTPYRWRESDREAAELFSDHGVLQLLSDSGANAWVVETSIPNKMSSAVTIRMILLGVEATDKKVTKLAKLLQNLSVVPLQPIAPGTEPSVLVCATVSQGESEMLLSNLRLRFPRAILRVEQ